MYLIKNFALTDGQRQLKKEILSLNRGNQIEDSLALESPATTIMMLSRYSELTATPPIVSNTTHLSNKCI